MLGGSYREYPIYFVGLIVFAFIAAGYLDSRPELIALFMIALIGAYLYLNPRRRKPGSTA